MVIKQKINLNSNSLWLRKKKQPPQKKKKTTTTHQQQNKNKQTNPKKPHPKKMAINSVVPLDYSSFINKWTCCPFAGQILHKATGNARTIIDSLTGPIYATINPEYTRSRPS